MPIRIFYEDTPFKLKDSQSKKRWVREAARLEGFEVGELSYIFCSDPFLLRLNQEYLNHNTLTDIITFDYSEKNLVAGDIFISIDRVFENAAKFSVSGELESLRVMIHGCLHLMGYADKSKAEKNLMREKENTYLSLWQKRFHVKQERKTP
jgi:probable rRNA maturation factor